ncbi:MAG: hypothetical protein A4E44_00272 [Methanosaeta sp. PtaB.Bin018]|nr:MAG: hypothetical protein A4E44_00272 [Methanosaeta sp. PtaB.Bin018]
MKYVKLLVALLAACMFVMPAFSMPNDDNQMKYGKAQIDAPCQNQVAGDHPGVQQPCDCMRDNNVPAPTMGPANDNCAPRSMMDGKMPCLKAIGEQNGKEEPAPTMGPANDNCAPRSMMDGKEQNRDRQCQGQ